MDILLGVTALAGLSLFLARWLKRSASVTPLVAVCVCMLWFSLWGAFNLLFAAGVVWYLGCFAALFWVVYKERGKILRLFTPGFVFFVVGSALFVLLYYCTQPMYILWDEFTFWGMAARILKEHNLLYTVADSNLIARSAPPGLAALHYGVQFFGAWAEYKLLASMAVLYMACFAAVSALLDRQKAAAAVLLGTLLLLPFLFETAPIDGSISWAYISTYADLPLAAMFGGGLALYFGGGKKDGTLFVMLALVAAALANVKDMGLVYAAVIALVALLDMLFVEKKEIRLFKLRGVPAALCIFVLLVGAALVAYGLWVVYGLSIGNANRARIGSGGTGMTVVQMVLAGFLALFGINRTEQFTIVLEGMLKAPFGQPVSLLGSGVRVLAVILVLLLFTWLLCRTKPQRRRVVLFAVAGLVGFAGFYIFNIFTYGYVFSYLEGTELKDYARYMFPYWMGWLTGTLVLLSATVADDEGGGKKGWRSYVARLTSVGVAVCLVLVVGVRGNLQANVFRTSPSLYLDRGVVRQLVDTAEAEGMQKGDVVYFVSQYDDGTHFYLAGYEMDATMVPVYFGTELDENGQEVFLGSQAVRLAAPDAAAELDAVPVDLDSFFTYLKEMECTHILLDTCDDTFFEMFSPFFEDGMEGWLADGEWDGGPRYYAIHWQPGDTPSFVYEGGGAA